LFGRRRHCYGMEVYPPVQTLRRGHTGTRAQQGIDNVDEGALANARSSGQRLLGFGERVGRSINLDRKARDIF
jgi:hypothetical protein